MVEEGYYFYYPLGEERKVLGEERRGKERKVGEESVPLFHTQVFRTCDN